MGIIAMMGEHPDFTANRGWGWGAFPIPGNRGRDPHWHWHPHPGQQLIGDFKFAAAAPPARPGFNQKTVQLASDGPPSALITTHSSSVV
jgi:hypothetical protein